MAKMSALARAQLQTAKYKKENKELAKEARAERRSLKREAGQALVIGGATAIASAKLGASAQAYLNENYAEDSKLRALTPSVPTLSLIGGLIVIGGITLSKDLNTQAVIVGVGAGLGGGALNEGTGLA